MRLTDVISSGTSFLTTMGATIVSASAEGTVLRLDAGPELWNHLGGPHAAVMYGLGETAAFSVLLDTFPDLVDAGAAPLVGRTEIAFSTIVRGVLLAEAGAVGDPAGVRAAYAERGSASFPVEVVFRREVDRVETGRATYQMAVRRVDGPNTLAG